MTRNVQSAAALLGRLLLCAIFFESGFGKLTGWERTRQVMEARGMPAAQLGLPVAVVAELAGGLALLLGFRVRVGAVVLLAFLVPATFARRGRLEPGRPSAIQIPQPKIQN